MNKQEESRLLLDFFSDYVTENKKQLIDEVLQNRSRYLTVALEDIYVSQNASAVIRSCDCFGFQDIHIIENHHRFKVNKGVTRGSSKWVDVHRYNAPGVNNTTACFESLKASGYKVYATTPHQSGYQLPELPLTDQKIALVFGNEHTGLSDYALQNADGFLRIPMYGFTESYNISVSAALCLYDIVHRLQKSTLDWRMSTAEREELQLLWYKKMVRRSEVMEKSFLASLSQDD